MKRLKINPSWVVATCLVFWGLWLLSLVIPSFELFTTFTLFLPLATVATIVSAVILIAGLYTRDPKKDKYAQGFFAKTSALLIIAAIWISTQAIIKSIWYSHQADNFGDKFYYENLGAGLGFAAIVFTIILSALQKDIYWISRKKSASLDERQLKDRRQVFETSYKLGVFLILLLTVLLIGNFHNIPVIIANNNNSVPGHIFWIGANLVIAMFALPLIVGSFKKR
jgi:hypothetical protein